ncbi:MAG: rod shape-determining protein RodA [Timaviella obliquedivisa GSE-PSE-MK23-08B]|jgi:rod shape determining protein RodA|nr:rod shape-determining protein RodA [Timaviella obliquedivisa GSE-PSE-MK23-08B]
MLRKSLPRVNWKAATQPWLEIDWTLLGVAIALTILGSIAIRSTELNKGLGEWWQQLLGGGIGIVLTLTLARWRYENLLRWHWITYGVMNVILLVVPFLGTEVNGAKSWLYLGNFGFQPSEFAKIALIVTLAAALQERGASRIPTVIKTLGIMGLSWVIIMLQPDLGTSLVFIAITLGMLYWANANPGWLLLLVSPIVSAILFGVFLPSWFAWIAVVVLVAWFTLPWQRYGALGFAGVNLVAGGLGSFVWSNVLKAYQRDRLSLFLDPDKDPLGGGYHLIQSRIAIGAGQLFGRGLNQGTQTQLNFIPEQQTDFIFSAIGEELGFMGCLAVLTCFWLISLRLVIIAQNAKDNFGSLLAIGVLSMIVFQVLINIGMTIGLAPVTGIPLPWLSYGRSSLLTNFIALGIVESVANYRHRLRF